jgi:predicted RNase H-like HicB family nuclease
MKNANQALPNIILNVALRKGENGYIVAECIEIPGCMSQGHTEEEATKNIADAIKACLAVMLEDLLKQSRQLPNLVGIEKQEAFRVSPPELEPVEA